MKKDKSETPPAVEVVCPEQFHRYAAITAVANALQTLAAAMRDGNITVNIEAGTINASGDKRAIHVK